MMIEFNWADKRWKGKKGSQLFEELCYELVKLEGFENLKWRRGSFDGGRDLQADFYRKEPGGSIKIEKWWFQCKRYSGGISLNALTSSFAKAAVEKVDYFVIMSTSHLTPTLQDDIEKINNNSTGNFRILDWTVKQLENLVTNHKNRIIDLAKYFDEDFETILRRIKEKEKNRNEILTKKKSDFEELFKKKKNVSDIYIKQAVKEIIREYRELKKYRESIDFIYELQNNLKDFDKDFLFEISIIQSDIFIEMGSAPEAISVLSRLEKNIGNDSLKQNLIDYKKALTFHNQHYFVNSLPLYHKSLNFFKKTNKELYNIIIMDLLRFYLDKGDYNNFDTLATKIRNKSKLIPEQKTLLQLKRFNKGYKYDSTIKLFKRIVTRIKDKEIRYRCYIEVAYAYWQKEELEKAIAILEKNCIDIINQIGDEEKLMIVFQNLSLLKMQLKPFDKSSWADHTKWVDLYNKFKGLYHNALISDLYSYEDMIGGQYNDAKSSLIKSKNYIEELGSWSLINKNNKSFGELFYYTGYYFHSLNNFIKVGNKDKIKNCTDRIIEIDNQKSINKYINGWLKMNNLSISERIGLCYALANFSEIYDEKTLKKVINKLMVLTKDKSTFTSNYDIRRPSIQALKNLAYRIPKTSFLKLISRLFELYEDESWDVRREALIVIEKLLKNHSNPDKIFFDKLLNMYNQEVKGPEQEIRFLIDKCLTNIALNDNTGKIKQEIIELFRTPNKKIIIELGLKLGIDFGINQVDSLLKNSINRINSLVLIKNKEDKDELEKGSSGITMTSYRKGKKIIVKTLEGLLPVEIFKKYKINPDLISKLIDSIIAIVFNEHNFLGNREILVNYLRFVPVPENKINNVYAFLLKIITEELPITKEELRSIQERNPFSTGKMYFGTIEAVKREALMAISELYNKVNENHKMKIEEIIINNSYKKEKDLRLACAYSFRFIPMNSLEKFLVYYSLLQDNEEQVFSYALFSFINSDFELWDVSFKESIINTIISISNKKFNHFFTNRSIAIALRKLQNSYIELQDSTLENISKHLIKLSKHKFYSVRKAIENEYD